MAEKKELGFVDTVLNWAKWGAVSFLGIWSLLATGLLPITAINTALTFAANGAMYGGLGGGIVASVRELGKVLFPKPVKAT